MCIYAITTYDITSLIEDIPRESTSVIGSTDYIHNATLFSGNNDQWRSKKGKDIPVTGYGGP
jgi:hypothetical protein